MLYAPITRLYSESYECDAAPEMVVPYQCNHNVFPRGMSACLGYLKTWQTVWSGDCFCYEYHFWHNQYNDPSQLYLAELLHRDIVSLKKHNLRGIVEDGSQRSFFPNGFAFYVYGETLFDVNVSFEELKTDYFRHAYGTCWLHALSYLETVHDFLDFDTIYRLSRSSSEERDALIIELKDAGWNSKLASLRTKTVSFRSTMDACIDREERVSTVAWSLLKDFTVMVEGVTNYYQGVLNKDEEGKEQAATDIKTYFSEREIYIERYYDHDLYSQWLK